MRLGETGGDPVRVDVPFRGGDPVRTDFVVLLAGLAGLGIVETVSSRFRLDAGRCAGFDKRTCRHRN